MKKIELNQAFQEKYALTEAYKSIRTNLLFCGKDVKVISITSCLANEGKSSFSMELAKNLAQVGKKVLLIDADLRKSVMVSTYSDQTGIEGLSQFLSGQTPLENVLYETQYEGFDIIFAGLYPPNPVDLLSSDAFKELLAYGREKYDYVLLDTPPLGVVIDGAVSCALSDGAILVISADRISYRFAETVKEQIEKSGCRILGAVLNQVDVQHSSYYRYSYRKYYGGKYGKRYNYSYSGREYGDYGYYGSSSDENGKGTGNKGTAQTASENDRTEK